MIEKLKKISMSKIVFLLFITTVIVSELTLSKYGTTFSRQDEVRVAVMGNDVSFNIIAPMDLYPGSNPSIIPLTITNKENDKICEVSQNFYIGLKKNETANIPLEFTFCKDEDCNNPMSPNENGIYSDQDFYFQAGIEETKKYYIKAVWPEEYNSETYAFEIDYIKIEIDATQID